MTKLMTVISSFLAGTLTGPSFGFLFAPEKEEPNISETVRKMKNSVDKDRRKLNQKIPVA